ncbi:serine/threonine-protein kinase [Chloroflexota bacterium]
MNDPQATNQHADPGSQQDDLIGRQIGQYEIIKELGRGGMATVYLAQQLNMTRQVAVKVLPREFLHDPQFIERFRREVQLIAELEHPHILPVYDFGENDNIPYIVMRYLGGGSLLDILADGLPPLAELERPVTQVCQALDYAHAEGIIHRDLKPSNILLDERGNAYLADFGIAQIMQDAGRLTGSAVIGTPAYMAPEQAEGRPLDARADVYALGVVLFELVTGRGPFQADTPMALLLKQITEPMPSPKMFRPDLPDAVENVILRATLKDPAGRYPSAAMLGDAFSAALRNVGPDQSAVGQADPVTRELAHTPLPGASLTGDDDDLATMVDSEAVAVRHPSVASTTPAPPAAQTKPPVGRPVETHTPTAAHENGETANLARASGRRRGLWIGLAVVVVLALVGIGVLASGVLTPTLAGPAPTPGPPTPFANANTYRGPENVYQVAMPHDWERRDVSEDEELAVLWHALDDSAYAGVRLLLDDDAAVDVVAFALRVDDYAARYQDEVFFTPIDEAEQPDQSLRVSYRVPQPDTLYEQFGRGQLDVFYRQVGPYFTMIEMFTSDEADLENLIPVMQDVLAAVYVDAANEWDLD